MFWVRSVPDGGSPHVSFWSCINGAMAVKMVLKDDCLWQEYQKLVSKIKNSDKVSWLQSSSSSVSGASNKKKDERRREETVLKQAVTEKISATKPRMMSRSEKRRFSARRSIDLHGINKSNLVPALEKFFVCCMKDDIRNVIVITGKGNGIIRQETRDFLSSASNYVISFTPLVDASNSYGSFIIRLKRALSLKDKCFLSRLT
jgi:DNA-nicking Smr family endonuclease